MPELYQTYHIEPLTLLVLLYLDLKPICLCQHISPRTVQCYRSDPDSYATRALYKFVLTAILTYYGKHISPRMV